MTYIVFVTLASLDNAAAGVLPPLYAIIARELKANEVSLGLVTAVYVLIVAGASVFWGYRGDKGNRKPLLFFGTLLWGAAMILTGLTNTFATFLLFQLITAVGVGVISSIGFSVVSDIIPAHRRGLALSLWGISQGIGVTVGSLLASTLGAFNWRYPFFVIAAAGFLFAILYLFTKEPLRGQAEPELSQLFAAGRPYLHQIRRSDIAAILRQRTNIWLLVQGFFSALAFGSTIWIPRWAIARVQAEGYDLEISTIVGNLFLTLFSAGFFFSILAGHIGDRWQKRNIRGRAYFAFMGLFSSIPFFVVLYFLPLRDVVLPTEGNLIQLVWAVFTSLFTNSWVMAMFIIAFIGLALQSIDSPNWAAIITNVNLPEHRGTVIGLSRVFRAVGNAVSVGGAGILIHQLTAAYPAPNNYAIGLALFQLLVIPAGLCYIAISRTITGDTLYVRRTLTERAKPYSRNVPR